MGGSLEYVERNKDKHRRRGGRNTSNYEQHQQPGEEHWTATKSEETNEVFRMCPAKNIRRRQHLQKMSKKVLRLCQAQKTLDGDQI